MRTERYRGRRIKLWPGGTGWVVETTCFQDGVLRRMLASTDRLIDARRTAQRWIDGWRDHAGKLSKLRALLTSA